MFLHCWLPSLIERSVPAFVFWCTSSLVPSLPLRRLAAHSHRILSTIIYAQQVLGQKPGYDPQAPLLLHCPSIPKPTRSRADSTSVVVLLRPSYLSDSLVIRPSALESKACRTESEVCGRDMHPKCAGCEWRRVRAGEGG